MSQSEVRLNQLQDQPVMVGHLHTGWELQKRAQKQQLAHMQAQRARARSVSASLSTETFENGTKTVSNLAEPSSKPARYPSLLHTKKKVSKKKKGKLFNISGEEASRMEGGGGQSKNLQLQVITASRSRHGGMILMPFRGTSGLAQRRRPPPPASGLAPQPPPNALVWCR